MDFSRHSRKTLYVVAGFYVFVGFALAITSAVGGDRLGTFLGFLIISGALVGAFVLRAILRVQQQVDDIAYHVAEIRDTVLAAERSLGEQIREVKEAAGVQLIDLSTFGTGDASALTAATLDRDVYPRLVATMEETPPAGGNGAGEKASSGAGGAPSALPRGPATKNLLRQWKIAIREVDLAACRAVLSTLVDLTPEEELAPLEQQFAALAKRVEGSLRQSFSAHVRNRDFEGALAVGERIVELLPESPLVADFTRIKPQLERCAGSESKRSAVR